MSDGVAPEKYFLGDEEAFEQIRTSYSTYLQYLELSLDWDLINGNLQGKYLGGS